MSTYTITFCDKCNPNACFSFVTMNSPKQNLVFSIATEEECLETGWEERDYGLICPICATAERGDEILAEAEGYQANQGIEILELWARVQKAISAEKMKTLDNAEKNATVENNKEATHNG